MQQSIILRELTDQIRLSKPVSKLEQLKSKNWTKSCFEQLSKIITCDLSDKLNTNELYGMGSSISYKTLKKIFEGCYSLTPPIDPRSLNTLNKISKYLDYNDWNDFVCKNDTNDESQYVILSDNELLISFIKTAIYEAFSAIKKLSISDKVPLKSYFLENSPGYNKIAEIIYHNKLTGLTINNKYNPSNCEIIDMRIETLAADKAIIFTKEYWLLCWWDSKKLFYHSRMKSVISVKYVISKSSTGWIITNTISKDDLFDSF